MPIDPFWFKLLLTFCAGGLWVTLTTLVADRFGSKVGGWIGGLPSTIVVTLFFTGVVESAQVASDVTTAVPLAIGFNSLFLLVYALLASHGFRAGLGGALLVWFALSTLAVMGGLKNFALSVLVFVLLSSFSYIVLDKRLHLPAQGRLSMRYKPGQLFGRAVLGGLVTTSAVALTHFGGPVIGGIFAVFPAVFISTLVITYQSRGLDFSRAIAKPLMLSGMMTIVIYAMAARYLFLVAGVVIGTLGAYALSVLSAYLLFRLTQKSV